MLSGDKRSPVFSPSLVQTAWVFQESQDESILKRIFILSLENTSWITHAETPHA